MSFEEDTWDNPTYNRFLDEDIEKVELKVKSSWDCSTSEEEDAPKSQPPAQPKKQRLNRRQERIQEQKRREMERQDAERIAANPYEEKMRQQRLQEASDLAAAEDLFGDGEKKAELDEPDEPDKQVSLAPIPKDPKELGSHLVTLLPENVDKAYKITATNAFIEKILKGMTSSEMNEIISKLNFIHSNTLKQERIVSKGKQKAKKTQDHKNKQQVYDDMVEDEYDMFM